MITNIDIFRENLEISLLRVGLEDNFIFQQDNDMKHIKGKKKSNRIKLLAWPLQSPQSHRKSIVHFGLKN